ncbi:MAG: alpha/beta fold hydrolase, partial [Pirellulales bacterium]
MSNQAMSNQAMSNPAMSSPAPQIRPFTAADGYRLATRVWNVENPLAHVLCLHGIVSHGGWYLASCAHLANAGFAVHMLDRRGSGLNPADPGDVDRWETWPRDVEQYLESLNETTPRLLLGISWGGTLATAVARRRPDLLQGLSLICPGLYSKKGATLLQRAALGVAGLLPLRSLRVKIPLQDPALFTGSESHQATIAADPLTLRKMTIRFARANQRLVRFATEKPE